MACLAAALGSFAAAWTSAAGHHHLVPFAARISTGPAPASAIALNGPLRGASKAARTSASPPVTVRIPAVGLTASVVPVGLSGSGQWQMPPPSLAGWYRLGPAPGSRGPAVLVGHVDSYHGPAVFYRLSGVRPGDTVQVARADGSESTFVISRVTVVRSTEFPTKAVFGPTARADIRLITCTGPFDTGTRSYINSLIVWGHATPS